MEAESELCGYLNKLSPKGGGLIKVSKRKWFKFSENTCILYYYVTPQRNGPPQGEINISHATFTFDPNNKTTKFTISTGEKSMELEAPDEQTAMFWVQELQKKRRNFTRRRNENKSDEKMETCRQRPLSGLVESIPEDVLNETNDDNTPCILPNLPCPKETVGVESINLRRRPSSRSWSFNSLKDQVVHSMTPKNKLIQENETNLNQSKAKGDKEIDFCSKCQQKISGEIINLQDELKASREIIDIFQMQIDQLARQRDTWLNSNYQNQRSIIDEKDLEISRLSLLVKNNEKELKELKNQIEEQNQTIQFKDEAIIKLSSEISQITQQKEQYTLLQDKLNAYETQNKILNSEILSLNQLRKEGEQREDNLILERSNWEAKFYQIQSKYILLLNNLHIPHHPQDSSSEERVPPQIIDQMFEDAISHHNVSINSNNGETVLLGFIEEGHECDEGESAENRATEYEKKSRKVLQGLEEKEESQTRGNKWDALLIGEKENGLRGVEMKEMVRSGIPHQYRSKMWNCCINQWVKTIKDKLPPNYYNKLLSTHTNVSRLDPASKQIELDLLRTLPSNKHYRSLHSDGIPRLRRVLLAYSWHNTEVGYCQGLNRIAAISLLYLNEECTFWCLVAIVECIMPPGYYCRSLIGSLIDQRVLNDIIAEKLPRLHSHLECCRLDFSLFTFNWFLCIFIDAVRPNIYLRIWDTFLYEGSKVLFRFAIAFFKMHEDALLQCTDIMSISQCMRVSAENMYNFNKFAQIAFCDINPFPMRIIKARRQHHTIAVQTQLDQVNKLRREYSLQRQLEDQQLIKSKSGDEDNSNAQ